MDEPLIMYSDSNIQSFQLIDPLVEIAVEAYVTASAASSPMPDSYFIQQAIDEFQLDDLQASELRLKAYQIRMTLSYELQNRLSKPSTVGLSNIYN